MYFNVLDGRTSNNIKVSARKICCQSSILSALLNSNTYMYDDYIAICGAFNGKCEKSNKKKTSTENKI